MTKIMKYLFHQKGWTEAVMLGIDHVLKRESEIIVLEDDCIPKDYFFDFIIKGRQYLSQSNICMLSTYVRNDIIKDLKLNLFLNQNWKYLGLVYK